MGTVSHVHWPWGTLQTVLGREWASWPCFKSHKSSPGLRGAFMWTFRSLRCQFYLDVCIVHPTLPWTSTSPAKLNIAPEKLPSQKERRTSSNHHVLRGSNLLWKTSRKFEHLSEPSFEASFSPTTLSWLSVKARSYGPRKRFQMMCGYLGSSVTSGIPITVSEWVKLESHKISTKPENGHEPLHYWLVNRDP